MASSRTTWLLFLAAFVAAGVIAWHRVKHEFDAPPAPRAEAVEASAEAADRPDDLVEVEIVETE